jgi:FlaA1/EpsC-like NDP-sugar epimerase
MLKIINNKLVKNNLSSWVALVMDCNIVVVTFVLAYLIRFNFSINFVTPNFVNQLLMVIFAAVISFLTINSHRGIIRQSVIGNVKRILLATVVLAALLMLLVYANEVLQLYPNFSILKSVLIIHLFFNGILLIVSRVLIKYIYYAIIQNEKKSIKALIYGAENPSLIAYNFLKSNTVNNYDIIGFIGESKAETKKQINGIIVYNSAVITKQFIIDNKVDEIIISVEDIKTSKLVDIINKYSQFLVRVKIFSSLNISNEGKFKSKQIRDIEIGDLFGRLSIAMKNSLVQDALFDKVILITGAAGSIGSEIARQISKYNYKKVILLDQAESPLYSLEQELLQADKKDFEAIVADIGNKDRITKIFDAHMPNLVFHAAAYKHVPLMENNPFEAVNVNVCGTKILADVSVQKNVEKFVLVSTDKAINPTNVMGATKRIAEMYISCMENTSSTKFITARFGNVLDSNGSVIPLFKKQIENGGPVTVTHKDISRYFMTMHEACLLVLEAGAMGKGGEIFIFDMGEAIKIYDLALKMIQLYGLKDPEDIKIKVTSLRPGEKICEQLLAQGENTQTTHHEKIMIAKTKPLDFEKVKLTIEGLCLLNAEMNNEKTVLKMKEIVPEFISNNSIYELLDKDSQLYKG